MPLGKIARSVGLKDATCSHLVATLVELGYAEKLGRREGYILGSKTYGLARHEMYRSDLAARARPAMEEAAAELGEAVTLSVLRGTKRILLCEIESTKPVQAQLPPEFEVSDIYNAASTWVLMAHLPTAELERFVTGNGLPWFESQEQEFSGEKLKEKLDSVRDEGFCLLTDKEAEISKLACPVWEREKVTAAIGVHLPAYRCTDGHAAHIRELLLKTAEKIAGNA